MENRQIMEKINELFIGKEGEVETFSEKISVGKFLGARLKNEAIIIFEFEKKHVGLSICIMVFSTIKEELAEGFQGEDVCKEIFIEGKNFWQIVEEILHQ